MPVKAFLSYSSIDKELAGDIKSQLERFGLEAFLAHDDIEPSVQWQDRIESELKTCQVFIPLVTEAFRESYWTDQEVGYALSRGVFIVPLNAGRNPYGFVGRLQAYRVNTEDVKGTCAGIAQIVARHTPFEENIIGAIIQTFGNSGSWEEATRNSGVLLEFQDFLTEDHIEEIKTLAKNNHEISKSFGARNNLSSLYHSFEQRPQTS